MPTSSGPSSNAATLLGERMLLGFIRRGLTMADVARAADMPQSQISRIVSGQTDPKLSTLLRICKASGLSLDELVYDQEVTSS